MMNFVFITTIYLPHMGGIEIYVHEIAQYLIKQGHSVDIIVADKTYNEVKMESIDGEKIIRIPANEINGFFFLKNRNYIQLIKEKIKNADIVHLNVSKFLFGFLAKEKRKFNYRLIVTSHGWLYHTQKHKIIKDFYFRHIIAKYAPLYDGIINVSYQDQDIAKKFGVKNTIVILNGVDCYKYSDLTPKVSFDGHFVYWGRISQNKGIFECLKKLSAYKKGFHFNIIGCCEDRAYQEKLDQFIITEGLSDKIKFLGVLPDEQIRKILEETDIILMPSLHEGFGMTLVECLLSGRPIIANTNESYEYILHCTNAQEYLFDFEDETSKIEDKINELLLKKIVPSNTEQFSIENMIEKTLAVYGI